MKTRPVLIVLGAVVGLFVLLCVVPNYLAYVPHAARAECATDLRELHRAELAYFDANHTLTSSIDELRVELHGEKTRLEILPGPASGASVFTIRCVTPKKVWVVSSEPQFVGCHEVPPGEAFTEGTNSKLNPCR